MDFAGAAVRRDPQKTRYLVFMTSPCVGLLAEKPVC
jgi:hypothetical protein